MRLNAEKLLEEARIMRESVGDAIGQLRHTQERLDDLIQDFSSEILKGKSFDDTKEVFIKSDGMHKIAAIKAIREASGLGLKEAKDVVEKWEKEMTDDKS